MSAAYLNVEKLSGAARIRVAAKHNLREIQAELGADGHIDARKSNRNFVLAGPTNSANVAAMAEQLMAEAGVRQLRRDAVRGIEVLVSLPPRQRIDPRVFFGDTLDWVRDYFNVPILSAIVHLDESAPHMHALILPLIDGRMRGSNLVGNKQRLTSMQADFFKAVASKYSLSRPKPVEKLPSMQRAEAANMALKHITSDPDCLREPQVREALHEVLQDNPEPLLEALRIKMPAKKRKGLGKFVSIMTKPVKPEPKSTCEYHRTRRKPTEHAGGV